MALQDHLVARASGTLHVLASWIRPGDWLEMRAVAAGLAEPKVLANASVARRALDVHRKILAEVQSSDDRTSEAFRVLRQGLGYTVSVVVAARPREGFPWLRELAGSSDRDVGWIVRENLKKKRLRDASSKEGAARIPRLNRHQRK